VEAGLLGKKTGKDFMNIIMTKVGRNDYGASNLRAVTAFGLIYLMIRY
jgi:hypothetical protein